MTLSFRLLPRISVDQPAPEAIRLTSGFRRSGNSMNNYGEILIPPLIRLMKIAVPHVENLGHRIPIRFARRTPGQGNDRAISNVIRHRHSAFLVRALPDGNPPESEFRERHGLPTITAVEIDLEAAVTETSKQEFLLASYMPELVARRVPVHRGDRGQGSRTNLNQTPPIGRRSYRCHLPSLAALFEHQTSSLSLLCPLLAVKRSYPPRRQLENREWKIG